MKYIKPYQIFEASASAPAALTQEQIDWLDECADWSWKLNPSTGLIDVDGDFDCREQGLTDLKGVKFGKVGERFDCEDNHLTSLVGAPQSVGGYFDCQDNHLTSLVGAPQTVGGNFRCHRNQLTTLVGAPQSVGGNFICENNQLTSLEGAPQKVGGRFVCEGNPVTESTLKAIFALMKKGMAYQQALEKRWPEMEDEDRALMYKQMPNLPPEETRKYKALATYNNIKDYL
jgi:hypothetical protein